MGNYPEDKTPEMAVWSGLGFVVCAFPICIYLGYWLGGMYWGLAGICGLAIVLNVGTMIWVRFRGCPRRDQDAKIPDPPLDEPPVNPRPMPPA